MKYLLFTFVLLTASCSSSVVKKMEAPERVGYSSRDLYGDVESLTYTTYKLKDSSEGIIRDEVLANFSFEFNAAGDVTQKKETDKLSSHDYTYKYDLNGKLLEEAGYNSDGSLFSKETYVYDSKGNVTEESSMVNVYKPRIVKYTFTYEPSGNKIATEYIDGVFTGKYAYKYDSSGNEIEKVSYNYDNVLSSTVVNNYDSNGNKIESMWRKSDGTILKKEVCEYDSDGNMIEETQYNSDGSLSNKTTYAYDSNGNKTEYCYYREDGSLSSKTTYAYDSNGNMIEQTKYNSDGSLFSKRTYAYDSSGNWIEITRYEGDALTPTEQIVREIVYRK